MNIQPVPTIFYDLKRILGKRARVDCFFDDKSLSFPQKFRSRRLEIHSVVGKSFIFIRIAKKRVQIISRVEGKEMLTEEWIPEKEYKFFLRQEKRIKAGTVFRVENGNWKRYSPSRVMESRKIQNELKDLKKFISGKCKVCPWGHT